MEVTMAISDRFSRHLNKIRKETGFQLNTSSLEQVRKSFLFNIGDVPDELKVEMYEYFIEQYGENGEDRRTIDELAEKLRAVVELFNFELNDEEALSDDDWDFIKETVSDYALDLDDETLTYIMRFVVERGGFDS
jgi:hypothetical protein